MSSPQFRRGTIGQKAVEREVITDAPAKPEPTAPRANKYGAPCVRCGVRVAPLEGRLEKVDGKWAVSHIPPCPSSPQAAQEPLPASEFKQTVVDGEVVYDGIYTVQSPVSGQAHRTFRLRTQGLDNDFMPGKQVIDYLAGADNDSDYVGFGHVAADGTVKVWSKHTGTPYATDLLAAWADFNDGSRVLKSVNCYRCGRTLTVPESVHNGLGPECAKRGL